MEGKVSADAREQAGIATAAQAVDFIYGRVKYGKKSGLLNMRRLLERLGNPHLGFPCVHVAGTNGKGSTCALIERALRAAGYRVGLYTSPMLERFNERIRVDGAEISDADLIRLTDRVRLEVLEMDARDEGCATFFEVCTAVMFLAFAQAGLDIAVLEAGVGGRLDSTNVVTPVVSVITGIGMDHMKMLGNSIEAIAAEKAGIIKAGRPVVIGRMPEAARGIVRDAARARGAALVDAGMARIECVSSGLMGQAFVVTPAAEEVWGKGGAAGHSDGGAFAFPDGGASAHPGGDSSVFPDGGASAHPDGGIPAFPYGDAPVRLSIGLVGDYQRENAALALHVMRVLAREGFPASPDAVRAGFCAARWPGRMEWFPRARVLMDGAHNEPGARALASALREVFPGQRLVLVVGAMSDKDVAGIVGHLAGIAARAVCTRIDSPRAMEAEALAERFRAHGVMAEAMVPAEAALDAARGYVAEKDEDAEVEDAVIVAGSLYLIGALMARVRELENT